MMRIDFESGKIIDLLVCLQYMCNDDRLEERLQNLGIDPDPDISDAFFNIRSGIDLNASGLELFFTQHYKQECFICTFLKPMLAQIQSFDDLKRCLKNSDSYERRTSLVAFYDHYKSKQSDYEEICKDANRLIDFVYALDTNEIIKWQIVKFIRDPDKTTDSIIHLLEFSYHLIRQAYQKNERLWNEAKQRFTTKYETQNMFFTTREREAIGRLFDVNSYEHVLIVPVLLNEAFIKPIVHDQSLLVILGVNYEKAIGVYSIENENINSMQAIKVLADEYRMTIIKMLRGRSLCASDIADNVNLSRSAVSYHLVELHQMGILDSKKSGKQRYYQTNQEMVNRVVALLSDMLYKEIDA